MPAKVWEEITYPFLNFNGSSELKFKQKEFYDINHELILLLLKLIVA